MIVNEWIPTGPIISCIGCGKTFNENRGKSGLRKGADVSINKNYQDFIKFTKINIFSLITISLKKKFMFNSYFVKLYSLK